MITISAFKWVPDFAQRQVRDPRARWALEEARLPYRTRLLVLGDQDTPGYRALQPFGQVPILEEDGLVIFEFGAIVLYIGERSETSCRRMRVRVHERRMADRGAQLNTAPSDERGRARFLPRQ